MINPDLTDGTEKKKQNPIIEASLFSKLLFLWLKSLFRLGVHRPIEEEDLYEPLKNHKSEYIANQFDRAWKRECGRHPSNPSFLRTLVGIFASRLIGYSTFYICLDIVCK